MLLRQPHLTAGYYTWRAGGMARKIKALFRVPGLYRVVPRFFYSMTERSFVNLNFPHYC